jgi:RNA polymerase sigma-70 factor (ECF subfamily)
MQSHLSARRAEWQATRPSAKEQELLDRFIDAHQRYDTAAALAICAQDIRVTMPPDGLRFDGLDAVAPLIAYAFGPNRDGDWRLVPTMANRMPTAASYLRAPGDTAFRAFKLDVLRVADGKIAEITTFGRVLFSQFGLPEVLPD